MSLHLVQRYSTNPAGYGALVAAVGKAKVAAGGLEGEVLVGPAMDGAWQELSLLLQLHNGLSPSRAVIFERALI